jgi:hypothetical protein
MAALGTSAARANITEIFASPTGIASPVQTITFDEIVLPANSLVTNQYSGLGVTFSGIYYDPQTGFGNVQGNDIGNFTFATQPAFQNPVTLTFSTPVTAAALSFDADGTPYLFQAFLGGTQVDSFVDTVGVSSSDYYGFQNEVFNQIVITQDGAGGGSDWVADNIQTSAAATPEPSYYFALSAGIIALLGFRKLKINRQRSN